MRIIRSVSEMQSYALQQRMDGLVIGFVPTMGFLHEGHLSLMRIAREKADVLVVSIFVNPTQFGPNEDFDRYPRDIERDRGLCESAGVDALFYPEVAGMYPPDASVFVDEDMVSQGLCGAGRPAHFRGVLTVVAKLFNMVTPDIAVFGQKDAQQLAVIRRMVRDLNFQVEIISGPIVREADGLAMSSRNTFLSSDEREQALWLHRSLENAQSLFAAGEDDSRKIEDAMRRLLAQNAPGVDLEYIAVVDAATMQPVGRVVCGSLIALAARVGSTRLIDNIILG